MSQPGAGWGLNIGGLIEHYRPLGWLIRGSTGSSGWTAVRLNEDGRPRGKLLFSLSLDDLATQIEARRTETSASR